MANLTPAVALASCEGALRQLLGFVLEQKHGIDWLTKVVKAETIVVWQERRDEERKKRTTRGVAQVSEDPLAYAHFYELVDLVKQQWNEVAPALGKKAVTGALLDRFDDLRNTVAHSRDLLPFEADLLSGIAGEIRNRVALFMSSKGPGGEHFARMEEVTDSFGNRVDGLATLQSSNPSIMCEQELHVGDVVQFRARGTDPHGRALRWHLMVAPGGVDLVEVDGDEVELSWTVESKHVSDRSYVIVRLESDSEFHRWSEGVDGMALFFYRVVPPHP